jgi:hypothetical protein
MNWTTTATTGEWESDDDTDADENGNLEGFIDDEEVSDSEAEYFA